MSTNNPAALLALSDAYAAASARRAAHVECASWASLDADRAMSTTRSAVADAWETGALALDDHLPQLAADAEARERAWHARLDATLTGAGR